MRVYLYYIGVVYENMCVIFWKEEKMPLEIEKINMDSLKFKAYVNSIIR